MLSKSLIPNKSLILRIDGGYESNGYLGVYPKANIPKSYLATGAMAGILNLLYQGDICAKPALTEDYYAELPEM